MSEAEIMRIFVQVALALEYLHASRILHRCVRLLCTLTSAAADAMLCSAHSRLAMTSAVISSPRYVRHVYTHTLYMYAIDRTETQVEHPFGRERRCESERLWRLAHPPQHARRGADRDWHAAIHVRSCMYVIRRDSALSCVERLSKRHRSGRQSSWTTSHTTARATCGVSAASCTSSQRSRRHSLAEPSALWCTRSYTLHCHRCQRATRANSPTWSRRCSRKTHACAPLFLASRVCVCASCEPSLLLLTDVMLDRLQARPEIAAVLRSEYVLRHVFGLTSVATFEQPRALAQHATGTVLSVAPRSKLSSLASQSTSTAHCPTPQHAVITPFDRMAVARNRVALEHQQAQLVRVQSDDLARQIFFENQV